MTFDMEADARAEPGFGSTGSVHTPGIQTPDSLCSSPAQFPSPPPCRTIVRFGDMITVGSEMSRPHNGEGAANLTRNYPTGLFTRRTEL
jgi:hypothetical protein